MGRLAVSDVSLQPTWRQLIGRRSITDSIYGRESYTTGRLNINMGCVVAKNDRRDFAVLKCTSGEWWMTVYLDDDHMYLNWGCRAIEREVSQMSTTRDGQCSVVVGHINLYYLVEAILNSEPPLPPPSQGTYLPEVRTELKVCEANTANSSVEEPTEVELKELPPHLEYAFLEGDNKLPVIIAKELDVEEKSALVKVEKTMEESTFMDDFSFYVNSFQNSDCLTRLDQMRQRCEDTNLSLNWEKSHFMVKEGIVLGHKISKKGIEVDKAKIDVIAKLPHPTTVKGIRSFLGHAGFYRRFIQDFSKISRPMTHLLEKNTPFIFSDDCIRAFQTLKDRLTEAPILIAPNWDLPFELMCDASDFPP
ncbi:reverse transcriptase domain-containing protein [Tanacetum coccineum]